MQLGELHELDELSFANLQDANLQLLGLNDVYLRRDLIAEELYATAIDEAARFPNALRKAGVVNDLREIDEALFVGSEVGRELGDVVGDVMFLEHEVKLLLGRVRLFLIIVSGNEGSVQTEDVSIEPQELWITVYDDLSYELAYEDPETAGVENITVYAQVPADWSGPCLWAWSAPDGTNAFAAWPGEAMTEADGWYALEAPGWINSVIINANEGGVQTSDLAVEPGKDVWVTVNSPEDASVSYEQPTGEPAEPSAEPSTEAEATPAASEAPAPAESGSSSTTLWIVIAVVVVAAVVIAVVVSKKKKKD